jgi:anti-sigma regulatory factor (Ser/Thr protein kinase)
VTEPARRAIVYVITAKRDDVHRDHHGHPPAADVNTDGQPFRWEGRAIVERLTDVRRAIQNWAEDVGLSADLIEELALASYEAMANAAEHAYVGVEPGVLSVLVETSAGQVDALVADQGKWQVPDPGAGFRGRGLLLIKSLAEDVTVIATEQGTTVRMRWRRD